MSEPEDDEPERPLNDSGDDSRTFNGSDNTLNSSANSGPRDSAQADSTDQSEGINSGAITHGDRDLTVKKTLRDLSLASAGVQEPAVTVVNDGDTLNASLSQLAGVENDAIRPLQGRFALYAKLAEGGMGEVFAARDSTLNRQVAVKVLARQSGAGLARFVREAQVTAQLSHPNVVPVYGLEETDQGSPALTMKLVHGVTFEEYIEQCSSAMGTPDYDHERHGENGRIEHFLRVCDAISYSHSRGVIHRDLKPDNLMIGKYGEVYVMDWGIARLQDELDNPLVEDRFEVEGGLYETSEDVAVNMVGVKTQVGAILGTPKYMSPEQGIGEGADAQSDQFSLGMVLFEMLTFEAPREIDRAQKISDKVPSNDRISFSETKQGQTVSPALQAIVNRATSKNPSDRYPSVEEFSDDLRRYVHGEEVHARPDNILRSCWRRLKRHPVAVMSALLVTLATAAAITTFGLYRGLEAERSASVRGQKLAGLVAAVSHRVNEFDALLFHVEGLLEGIATSGREQLEHAAAEPYQIYQTANIRKSSEFMERYHQRISYDDFVVVLPPEAELDDVQDQLFRLGGLGFVLRDALFRSANIDASELSKDEGDAILKKGTPVHWAYMGLANGVMINYPGNGTYPSDYDPRKRPWFKSAVTRKNVATWGTIYPDSTGSGYQMPCNQSFYDQSGKFLGVAGLDISMDTVIQEMEIPEVAGVKEAWMMDDSGRVVLRSGERGKKTAVAMLENKSKEREILGIPELEAHAKKGTTSGFVIDGQDVLVFARLKAVNWFLVARIEARPHGL